MSSSSWAWCGWVPTEQKTSRKALGDGEQLGVPLHPRRDRDHAADAGRARARDDGVELVGEVRKIEMAMAVDQHRSAGRRSGWRRFGST